MVRAYYYLHLLTGAAVVTAQVTTHVLLPSESYKLPEGAKATPAPDEIVVQDADDRINIFAGSNRQAAIKKANEGCNGQMDETCFKAVSDAWGYGPEGDETGLSRRFIPAVLLWYVGAVFVVGLAYLYQLGDGISIPKESIKKPEGKPQPTAVFQAPGLPAVTVTVPPAKTDNPPEVAGGANALDLTFPREDVDSIMKVSEHITCKRSSRFRRRQDSSDAWRDCVELAAQSIAQSTDIGGLLQRVQGVRLAGNLPNNQIPLPADFPTIPQALQDVVDLLSIFGPAAEEVRKHVARWSLLVAWVQLGAGIEIQEKTQIPYDLLNKKTTTGDEEGTCKAPEKGGFFCDQECGGKDPLKPGKAPLNTVMLDDYSQTWSCKGRDGNDNRKGCNCVIPHPKYPHTFKGIGNAIAASQKIFTGAKFVVGRGSGDKKKTCYKADTARMKDRRNWKFVQQQTLDENIKDFCSEKAWDDMARGLRKRGDGRPRKRLYHTEQRDNRPADDPYDRQSWNKVIITASGEANREDCMAALMEISAGCDWDSTPLEEGNLNQFNFKWGGELVSDGATWTIEPQRERVVPKLPDNCKASDASDANSPKGNKGLNGKEITDQVLMAGQMCLAQGRIIRQTTKFSCGGYWKYSLNAFLDSAADPEKCSDVTYGCSSFSIMQGGVGAPVPPPYHCYSGLHIIDYSS